MAAVGEGPSARGKVGLRYERLKEANGLLLKWFVKKLLQQETEPVDRELWTRSAAEAKAAVERRQADVLRRHHAVDQLNHLDAISFGLEPPAVEVELNVGNVALDAMEVDEATSHVDIANCVEMESQQRQLELLRQYLAEQVRRNNQQAATNAELKARLKNVVSSLDRDTSRLLMATNVRGTPENGGA